MNVNNFSYDNDVDVAHRLNSKFRALARKEKNSAFCMNWAIKHNWWSRGALQALQWVQWGTKRQSP